MKAVTELKKVLHSSTFEAKPSQVQISLRIFDHPHCKMIGKLAASFSVLKDSTIFSGSLTQRESPDVALNAETMMILATIIRMEASKLLYNITTWISETLLT
ncbi:hypothetical protein [Lancefieldella rimae]|uniref:hypothetical protein n=1 Tax=Lancefieldella rimae TaxID=1383 RepID=UPI003C705778